MNEALRTTGLVQRFKGQASSLASISKGSFYRFRLGCSAESYHINDKLDTKSSHKEIIFPVATLSDIFYKTAPDGFEHDVFHLEVIGTFLQPDSSSRLCIAVTGRTSHLFSSA